MGVEAVAGSDDELLGVEKKEGAGTQPAVPVVAAEIHRKSSGRT